MSRLLLLLALVFLSGCSRAPSGPTKTLVYRANFEASFQQGLQPSSLSRREKKELLQSTAMALRDRIDPAGVLELDIDVKGTDIVVELPTALVKGASAGESFVEPRGRCGFHMRATDAYFQGASDVEQELARAEAWLAANPGASLGRYNALPFESGGPWQTERRAVRVFPVRSGAQGPAADRLAAVSLEVESDWRFFFDDLKNVDLSSGATGLPALAFELMDHRKAAFRAFTAAHVGEPMAVVIDGEIVAIPVINAPLPGAGIIEGGSSGFTPEETRRMLGVLRTGALPVVLELVSR